MNPLLAALVQAGLFEPTDADRLDRQLDSVAARQFAEDEMLRAFNVALAGQRDRLIDTVRAGEGVLSAAQQNKLWAGENDRLWASVSETLLDVASERAVVAAVNVGNINTWNVINQSVIDWAEDYYANADVDFVGSIPSLNLTSRTAFQKAFVEWQRGELQAAGFADGLPSLIRALEPIFGLARAQTIGVTETSRLFAMAELETARANPFITTLMWETSMDERTCPICLPRHATVVGKESDGFRVGTDSIIGYPPAHTRCRCRIVSLTTPALDALRAEGFVHG